VLQEERRKNHPVGNIELRKAMYPTYSLNWDKNSWLKKKHIFSSYPLERVYKERTRSLLSASYANQHWEFVMDLLQTRNFARGRFAHRIRHTRAWRRLSKPHLHHVESSHTRRKRRTQGEHIGRTARRQGKNTRKSFTAFHVQPNRHIFQSKARIATKQRLYVPRVHRGFIRSHLTSCLWDADIPGYMDDTLDSSNPNTVLEKRAQYIQGNSALDHIGHLHCNVFNQDKFLINGVEVRMRFVRSKDSFRLMESKTISKIRILDANVFVRRTQISPGVLLAYARMLNNTAKYSLTRVEVKTFMIHTGVVGESINNAIFELLPKRLIVDNKAFKGDRKLNLFNFKNFNYGINFFSLYADGMQILNRYNQIFRKRAALRWSLLHIILGNWYSLSERG